MNSSTQNQAKFSKTFISAAALRADIDSKDDGDEIRRFLPAVDALNAGYAVALLYQHPGCGISPMITKVSADADVRAPRRDPNHSETLFLFRVWKKVRSDQYEGYYCGSFIAGVVGVVDVFEKNGHLYVHKNFFVSPNDEAGWKPNVCYNINRFEIWSGEEGLMKEYNDKAKKLSELIAKNFGAEVLQMIKVKVLTTLEVVASTVVSTEDLKKVLAVATEPSVIFNMLTLIEREIPRSRAQQASRGYAWGYVKSVLSGVPLAGKLSDVSEAIRLYVENF